MKSNFALRTLILLAAWLVFENFNLPTLQASCCTTHGTFNTTMETKASLLYSINGSAGLCFKGCKSMETAGNPVLFSLNHSTSAAPIPPYRIKTIVLDAGHGGKDPGCVGASAFEKDNALAIVLRLGAYIEANYPEIKVIYTRDADFFVELNERAAIANRNKADLFMSVHCNALSVKSAHGAETYVLGLHRSKDNLDVAKRENSSIYLEKDYQKNYAGYDPDSPEAEIFASVWQSAYLEQSILLASYVQQFANAVAFRDDRGVKQAGFLVLRETAMPSVLIETGYLTNATEEEFLASEEGREQMALAIFQSFEAYKRHMETGKSIAAAANNKQIPAKTVAQKVSTTPVRTSSGKATADTKPSSQAPPKPTTASVQKPVASQKTNSAVLPKTDKPIIKPQNFTILLLAWPNRLDPNVGQLSLLANVKEFNKDGKYHYYSGVYTTKAEAEKVLPEIQNMGFKTATIVQN